jgi:hypothetical protein
MIAATSLLCATSWFMAVNMIPLGNGAAQVANGFAAKDQRA